MYKIRKTPYLLLVILGVTALSLPPQGRAAVGGHGDPSGLQDIKHLMMVVFSDKTINTIKGDASPTSYRPRVDSYQSSWSNRVSKQLAEDYGLAIVTEWPVTEAGVHCVVYRIPYNAVLSAAIGRLSKDPRIEIVQEMHVYNSRGQCCN